MYPGKNTDHCSAQVVPDYSGLYMLFTRFPFFNRSLPKCKFTKRGLFWLLFLKLLVSSLITAQVPALDRKVFFAGDQIAEMALTADFTRLISQKKSKIDTPGYYPATLSCDLPGGIRVNEEVEIKARGEFRKAECYLPPIFINFKTPNASYFKDLGRLKLVWPCGSSGYEEQLVLKEYLAYKIYNLLTEKSFRVRLIKLSYRDTQNKIKPHAVYAFFIEDVDDMARRNNSVEIQGPVFHTEQTNRRQTTLVALYEYMIGNTDWAIPLYRNIRLIRPKEDGNLRPDVVPYDFDYCGLVNADYAFPPPEFAIASVQERVYRGFPRTMNELQDALKIFHEQREPVYSMIQNFEPLSKSNKREMTRYLQEFYTLIEKEENIREIFITNARRE